MAELEPNPPREHGLADFWREQLRGGHPDPQLLSLPGIEQLRRQIAGLSPEAPLSRLTGMRLESINPGEALFRMPMTGWLPAADGRIPPGPLAIPADAAMACAIMSELPARTLFTTSEMTLRVLQEVRPEGDLHAHGRVIAAGPPVALAEVELRDDDGVLVAHGSSLCVTLPPMASPPAHQSPAAEHPAESPDPWARPAPAPPFPHVAEVGRSGLDVLQSRIAGDSEPAPLERFLGLMPWRAVEGETEYRLPASPWFCAPPPGRLQGGVTITLAEAAMFDAVRTLVPAELPVRPVELKINLLRPLASDGRPARALGRVVHSGRRIAVCGAEVSDADGRPIAVATGSALLGEAAVVKPRSNH
ncbi:MAG: PaaI family thioesterase [Solirubrobacteraceae bacterium]